MAHPHGGAKARDAALDSAARRQNSADEGVPRYDPHAAYHDPSTNLHPHDAHERRAPSEVDDRAWRSKAEVEEWRSAQVERRASVARSVASGRSSTRGAQETLGGLSEGDLAHMSDAEIAQHHFRLAQQHLEAAQRLSLAAAETPSRYARSAQSSSVSSLRSPQAPFAYEQDSASSSAYGESSFGQDDQLRSPVSVSSASPIERDLRRLSIDRRGSASGSGSYDERRRSALQVPPPTRALEPPPHAVPSSSSRFSTSPSSISLRSAPSHPSTDGARAVPQRPVPPPRRATVGAVNPPAAFESASALAPSLYGGGVPLGVPDRLGVRSASAGSSPADSVGVSRSASSSSSLSPYWPGAQARDAVEQQPSRSFVEHDVHDPAEDVDDARSDFFDAQSTISHVTNSPLPSYSDPYERPAVPSVPEEYLRPVASAPPASVVGDSSGPPSPSPSHEPVDEFHGFRPRHALVPQHYSSHPPSLSTDSTVSAQPSSSHPPSVGHGPPPSAHVYAHPVAALGGAQPHSYIVGADGRPIPVYSAPAGLHYRAGQSAPRSALPIHSQPLQFDHSLPYAHRPPQTPRGPVVTTAGVHPTLTANTSPLQPYSPHASPLAPSALPTLSTRTSTACFAPFTVGVVPRPPSPSASSTTTATHRAPSISGRSRMASLRAAVKSPHVRFMSPSPEARSRASEPPPPTSTSTSTSSRSGRVGSSSGASAAAARGRMGSFFGASASGGDALRLEQARATAVVPEVDDEESEAERRKRQGEAMQQSFGMLL
ncbi:uncharacterized protein RHOBADRAFT_56322 [Rhodotorula graminis WP1]|uniref:Uncharacterized protein n=1 Tax=Rhodotorula graminis (strain WP1) TaxID=578459 RepID=A0A0N8PZC6_RHOGW|nr:uncharacterized protein RHOBADRAFT_56322 [Rhodotorula graminis WP1]KPV71949.1 hypothetical protein RHOBADRAFT_56322 [Rhodotorula graminis WP1]